ncbi:MAG: nitrous oxide reductase accessory protein NosL [Candidatus Dadabacteria bacterium]|nr:nitrous oxide reductase accessory protein NosL [Candidatus Dadabacteria bacterium]
MRYVLFLLLAALFTACGDRPPTGPVEVHYGEDVCERCRMIISDQRFAAQYVTEKGEAKKFDDIGCLAAELKTDGGEDIASGVYVADFATGAWIDARKAHYLKSADIASPMGYGIAAFASEEALKSGPGYGPDAEIGGFDDIVE